MTSLGHSIVGASIGLLYMPQMDKARQQFIFIVIMIAIASLPDWPIPGWGHSRLDISHSIIVNLGVMICIAVGLRSMASSVLQKYRRIMIGAMAAWLSHFLLDTLYTDSSLAIFRPLSDATVTLPIPWLKTMPHVPPPFDLQILQVFIFEVLTFLPLLVLAIALRRKILVKHIPTHT